MVEAVEAVFDIFIKGMKDLACNEVFWVFLFLFALIISHAIKLGKEKKVEHTVLTACGELVSYLSEAVCDFIDGVRCAISFKDGIRMMLFGHFAESAQFVMMNYAIVFLSIGSFFIVWEGLNNILSGLTAAFTSFGLHASYLLFVTRLAAYCFPKIEEVRKSIFYFYEDKVIYASDMKKGVNENKTFSLWDRIYNYVKSLSIIRILKFIILTLATSVTGLVIVYFLTMAIIEAKYENDSEEAISYDALEFIVEDSGNYIRKLNECFQKYELQMNELINTVDKEVIIGTGAGADRNATLEKDVKTMREILEKNQVNNTDKENFKLFIETAYDKLNLVQTRNMLEDQKAFERYCLMKDYFLKTGIYNEIQQLYVDIGKWSAERNVKSDTDSAKEQESETDKDVVKERKEILGFLNRYISILGDNSYEIRTKIRDDGLDFDIYYNKAVYWQMVLLKVIDSEERAWRMMSEVFGADFYSVINNILAGIGNVDKFIVLSFYFSILLVVFIGMLCIFRGRMCASIKNSRKRSAVIAAFLGPEEEMARDKKNDKDTEKLTYVRKSPKVCDLLDNAVVMRINKNIFVLKKEDQYTETMTHFRNEYARFRKDYRYKVKPFMEKRIRSAVITESYDTDEIVLPMSYFGSGSLNAEFSFFLRQGLVFPVYTKEFVCKGYVLGEEFLNLLFDCVISKTVGEQSIERVFKEEMVLYEEPEDT